MNRPSVHRWLLLEGDRNVVAVALLAAIFVLVLALSSLGAIDLRDPDAVRTIGGGLIPGLFTFISIVLAINQLVLSQEFGSAEELQERVQALRGFRHEVERAAESAPSPILPSEFLALVVQTVAEDAAALEAAASEADRDETAIEEYAATVRRAARAAADRLEERSSGRIHAVLSVLEYPESAQLFEARRLREEYGDELSGESSRALADLLDALELFSVARMQFRSRYTQRVLARLSRRLLYVGVPALLASFALVLLPSTAAPSLLDRYGDLVVAALLVVALSPLAVLFAYILRIATVSERTIGVGPFVSRPEEGETRTEDGRAEDSQAEGRRAE